MVMALMIMAAAFVPQMKVSAAPAEVAQAALGIDVSRYQGRLTGIWLPLREYSLP